MRSLILLPLLSLAVACGVPEVDMPGAEESGSAVTSPAADETPAGEPAAAPADDVPSCGTGSPLDDMAMLARAPQGGAAVLTVAGKTRTTTRTCTGDVCVADLAGGQGDAKLVLTRTPDGTAWRGQVSPSSAITLSLEVTREGGLSGELLTFGEAPGSARLEGKATTACFFAQATAKVERGDGKRVETTVWFSAEAPAEEKRVIIEEQPPVPSCDQLAPAASAFAVVTSGVSSIPSSAVLEQYRDCRAPTGCLPWQTGPVGVDGSSPWARDPSSTTAGLTASGNLVNIGRGLVQTIARNSAGAQASFTGVAATNATGSPILGRGIAVDVKLTSAAMVLRENGAARDDAADPRVRTRRFACLAYVR